MNITIDNNLKAAHYSPQRQPETIATPSQPRNIMEHIKENPGYVPTMQEKTIINAIERANKKISGSSMEFEFSVHEQTKQILIKVINSQTKEIVREIPSEKILDMVANMCELAGLFVDEKR